MKKIEICLIVSGVLATITHVMYRYGQYKYVQGAIDATENINDKLEKIIERAESGLYD